MHVKTVTVTGPRTRPHLVQQLIRWHQTAIRQGQRDQQGLRQMAADVYRLAVVGEQFEGPENPDLHFLAMLATRTIADVTIRPAEAQHLRDLAKLRRVRDRIDREYAQPLDVEALARGAHMSAGHFSREFRLAYGESPYSYLMTRRIERAMALLRRGELSVTEVCFAVGCSSLGTFSTRFAELVGVPPSTYRRLAAGATAGMPPCVAKQVTRPVRNREAPRTGPQLA